MTPELLPGQLAPTVAEAGPGPPPRPKLRRPERRPDPGGWRDVIPPALAEQIADGDALKAHRALVERVEQATRKLRELEAAHAEAVEKDRQAEHAFAERGRKLPPANTYGHVVDELEDAPRIAAEDAIAAARRGSDVRTEYGRPGQ